MKKLQHTPEGVTITQEEVILEVNGENHYLVNDGCRDEGYHQAFDENPYDPIKEAAYWAYYQLGVVERLLEEEIQ